jgi:hypothetical protein
MSIFGEQDADSRNFSRSNDVDIATDFKRLCGLRPPGQTCNSGLGMDEGVGEGAGQGNGGHETDVCRGRPIGS